MSYRTDDTLLPASSLDSCSENSSPSLTSSFDQSLKHLSFLNNSWPFLDKLDDQYSSVDSWRGYTKDGMEYDIKERYSRQSSTPSVEDVDDSYGCKSDASKLYSFRGTHYNPSASGQRTNHELEDCVQWVNGYLQFSTANERHVTDLTQCFADGKTFLLLVEMLLGVAIPPVHVKPALDVQKTENIQKCLDVLKLHGVPMRDNITTEDILKKNAKIVLALCQCLRKHFDSSPGSSKTSQIQRTTTPFQSSTSINRRLPRDTQTSITLQSPRVAVMDIEDIAILEWVSSMTNHTLKGYESLQDGHILCLLVNKMIGGGAVPDVVLEYGLPSEKINLALSFSEEELGTTIVLNCEEIIKLTNPAKLSLYLQELHQIFLEHKLEEKAFSGHSKVKELDKLKDDLIETKDWDYFLEFKNLENIHKKSKQYTKLDFDQDKVTRERDNFTKPRKTLEELLHSDISDDAMLLPRETVFDPIRWQLPYKPLANKSWEKEREKAKVKIDVLNEQLKLLKEQYFRYMNLETEEEPSIKNLETTSTDDSNSPVKLDSSPHKEIKSSPKVLSKSFNSYFDKKRGTTPPYRTWSMYVNTEGDRYKAFTKKRSENIAENVSTASQNSVLTASFKRTPNDRKEFLIDCSNDGRETKYKEQDMTSLQIKRVKNAEARGLTKTRPSDARSVSRSNYSQRDRHLTGITALVRLSSMKANALSDNES